MNRRDFIKSLGLGGACLAVSGYNSIDAGAKLFSNNSVNVDLTTSKQNKTNIIFILADDLGYGDVSCLNPTCRVTTPNIDKLASEGMTFTDSHTTSAVCTPTRYGILTGRYNWRSRLKYGVLYGYSLPLIEQGRATVASFMKENGYATACIGKWHLGLGWALKPEYSFSDVYKNNSRYGTDYVGSDGKYFDFDKPFANGPTTKGFDYYYGIAASLDMPPYTYLENDRVTVKPTVMAEQSEFGRVGLKASGFDGHNVLGDLTRKAVWWIEQNKDKPFFLYFPLNAPHTPHRPSAEFEGKSGVSPFYDFVLEVDWTVGQIMDALSSNGIADNTVLIVTSDNGPERTYYDGCGDGRQGGTVADEGEDCGYAGSSGPLRGRKRDSWDGGHRTPYFVRWPGKIQAGSTSSQTICTSDLFSTCSNIIGNPVRPPDSMNILPAYLGTDNVPIREGTVHHSSSGEFSIRKGKWKLITHRGSGGNSYNFAPNKTDTSKPVMQLFDMEANISENDDYNHYTSNPGGKVQELQALLDLYKSQGHSRSDGAPDFM